MTRAVTMRNGEGARSIEGRPERFISGAGITRNINADDAWFHFHFIRVALWVRHSSVCSQYAPAPNFSFLTRRTTQMATRSSGPKGGDPKKRCSSTGRRPWADRPAPRLQRRINSTAGTQTPMSSRRLHFASDETTRERPMEIGQWTRTLIRTQVLLRAEIILVDPAKPGGTQLVLLIQYSRRLHCTARDVQRWLAPSVRVNYWYC